MGKRLSPWSLSPLETGSETPEQQQDSSPCQAKRSPTKCFPSPLEPIKNSSFVWHPRCEAGSETIGASPLEAGSETLEQQQDSSPCQAKRSPTKCFPSPLEPIRNSSFVWHPRCEAGSETIAWRKSLGGRFRNTRTAAGFELVPKPLAQKSLGGRFRNTRTAAGFEPMPSKTQPDKMLPVTFGTHKKQFFCLAPSRAHAKQNAARQNASRHLWNP